MHGPDEHKGLEPIDAKAMVERLAARQLGAKRAAEVLAQPLVKNEPDTKPKPPPPELVERILITRMGAPRQQAQIILGAHGKVGMMATDFAGHRVKLEPRPALARTMTWIKRAKQRPRTLGLSGEPQCGKTTAAIYPLYLDALRGAEINERRAYWPAYVLGDHSTADWADEKQARASLTAVRTLVIDNVNLAKGFGTSKKFDGFAALFAHVLEERQNKDLVTIITTNHALRDIQAHFGAATASHFSSPRGAWLQLTDPSKEDQPHPARGLWK